jgi:predicted nucleic acid-binding protein
VSAIYVETSALLRLVFKQDGAEAVSGRLASAGQAFTSRLARVEGERAILRWRFDHPKEAEVATTLRARLAEVCSELSFLEITREVCDMAGTMAPAGRLRSLDAIHLASFRLLKGLEPSAEMLTFDDRVREAL